VRKILQVSGCLVVLAIAATFLGFIPIGNQSITGPDKNHDGVRDDVDEFIEKTYPNSEKARAASLQLAKAIQYSLEHPELGTELRNNYEDHKDVIGKAVDCIFAVLPDGPDLNDAGDKIERAVVNTRARVLAYIKYSGNLSGAILPSWDTKKNGTPCDFDINKLKN